VREFLVRQIIHRAQIGLLLEMGDDDLWRCTSCGACVDQCPKGVDVVGIFRAARRIGAQYGAFPKNLKPVMSQVKNEGNPWSQAREKRGDWARELGIKAFTPDTEYLYVPCCTLAYDLKARRVAVATSQILQKAGVDFGILGAEESCCGESVRKLGREDLFEGLSRSNIKTFRERGVRKIIVSSPHCYDAFKKEYPEQGASFEVIHVTQLLAKLMDAGKINAVRRYEKTIAYHDPCYLGRHNSVYDEPRQVLAEIPGVRLKELPDHREEALCCGGGGGRIWMDTRKGERFSDIRLLQAVQVGVDILAVACPYCMLNFDESVLGLGPAGSIEVMDISEIVCSVL
jgi:Fe-S oxidoreductase